MKVFCTEALLYYLPMFNCRQTALADTALKFSAPLMHKNHSHQMYAVNCNFLLKHQPTEQSLFPTIFKSHLITSLLPFWYRVRIKWICSAFLYMTQSMAGCYLCNCTMQWRVKESAFIIFLHSFIQFFPSICHLSLFNNDFKYLNKPKKKCSIKH